MKQSVNGDYQKICKQVIAFEPRAEITIDTQFIKKNVEMSHCFFQLKHIAYGLTWQLSRQPRSISLKSILLYFFGNFFFLWKVNIITKELYMIWGFLQIKKELSRVFIYRDSFHSWQFFISISNNRFDTNHWEFI